MNKQVINYAYDQLQETKVKYNADADLYANAKAKIEDRKVSYIRDGRVTGKNKETREANLAKLVNKLAHLVIKAENKMKDTRLELELAQIEVDRVRLIIRLLELDHSTKPTVSVKRVKTASDPNSTDKGK